MASDDPRKKFRSESVAAWRARLHEMFPHGVPEGATWTDTEDIVGVLNAAARPPATNHLFYPTGGGDDLDSAALSAGEPGCVEIVAGGGITLVRPAGLEFCRFGPGDDLSYFRLNLAELRPSGVYPAGSVHDREEVAELGRGTGEYVDRGAIDAGEYEGRPLPPGSHAITRQFRGSVVVFAKGSTYNELGGPHFDAYGGRHSKMSSDEFRRHVLEIAAVVERVRLDH